MTRPTKQARFFSSRGRGREIARGSWDPLSLDQLLKSQEVLETKEWPSGTLFAMVEACKLQV